MTAPDAKQVTRQAERIYEQRLRSTLEKTHPDHFVAIEPVSGDHFLGHTLSEAIGAARQAYPERLSFVFRVGHRTAVQMGASNV